MKICSTIKIKEGQIKYNETLTMHEVKEEDIQFEQSGKIDSQKQIN